MGRIGLHPIQHGLKALPGLEPGAVMTLSPPLASTQATGLPEVEAAILYGSRPLGRQRAGLELYRRRLDAAD